ncbi:MAG: chorismate mutase [Anaerolineales bacterium]|nr:chorismate mutase [Anaerolineales bacterium]
MALRGIRGAIGVIEDQPENIIRATKTLLESMLTANPSLRTEDVASVIFTVTPDLSSTYPAKAARDLGWNQVPILCTLEIPVPEGLPRILRILIHWNTEIPQKEVSHVYLGDAARLRPDLTEK